MSQAHYLTTESFGSEKLGIRVIGQYHDLAIQDGTERDAVVLVALTETTCIVFISLNAWRVLCLSAKDEGYFSAPPADVAVPGLLNSLSMSHLSSAIRETQAYLSLPAAFCVQGYYAWCVYSVVILDPTIHQMQENLQTLPQMVHVCSCADDCSCECNHFERRATLKISGRFPFCT